MVTRRQCLSHSPQQEIAECEVRGPGRPQQQRTFIGSMAEETHNSKLREPRYENEAEPHLT
jgi:hypothetical protein